MIPYLKTIKQHNGGLPIVSITVGPTLNQELSYQSVIQLLGTNGYFDDENRSVRIINSNVPLTRTD